MLCTDSPKKIKQDTFSQIEKRQHEIYDAKKMKIGKKYTINSASLYLTI